MRLTRTFAALAVLVTYAIAGPVKEALEVKHAWADVPRGWAHHGEVDGEQMLNLRIGLKEANIDKVIEHLYEVSDPAHPRYGDHLSKADVDALVAPCAETVSAVDAWLLSHDIDPSSDAVQRSSSGDWIHLSVPVSTAERMMDTTYHVYRHLDSGDLAVRTLSYSLPREVHAHIDTIQPTTMFGRLRSMKATSFLQPEIETIDVAQPVSDAAVPSSCNTVITPSCLRTLYNTVNYTPAATSTNKIGIAGYLEEFANTADLQTFFSKFRPDASGSFQIVQVNGGGNDQTDPGVEANLDIQYTEGMTFPTPNIYYSTGGSPPFTPDSNTPTNTNEPYADWLTFILAQSTVPQTLTTSYGDDEQTVPFDYATRACNSFAQLGARGSSIMFSSGDDGVGAGDCKTNDGTNKVRFQPNFPASCPFVTTVGGTTRTAPEVGISFSGGGFSNYFAQPSYQSSAVKTFLTALGSTNAGLFNTTGRAYPDVAAQSNGFQVVIGGRVSSVGGTSASSPTFAGVVALLNDVRIANKQAPLGFLNPALYSSLTSGMNDITSGSNPGCSTNGFTARAGWDPVTGLGTPDFVKLSALVKQL